MLQCKEKDGGWAGWIETHDVRVEGRMAQVVVTNVRFKVDCTVRNRFLEMQFSVRENANSFVPYSSTLVLWIQFPHFSYWPSLFLSIWHLGLSLLFLFLVGVKSSRQTSKAERTYDVRTLTHEQNEEGRGGREPDSSSSLISPSLSLPETLPLFLCRSVSPTCVVVVTSMLAMFNMGRCILLT